MAFSQLLGLLPWPWCPPPLVVSSGLPLPMQSPAATAEGLSGPLFGAYTFPTFKFQPRHDSMDWRRISTLDVDRVARELDVATLQENIAGITFCNLDREVCSRCGQPVDPALLKVLRLAQLIIEYLLHCQDCLSASVAQLEARLQTSLGQQQRGQQELGRQADELKGVREESRRRRKMISTLQQLLMQTGTHSYHTCHLCDKTFMNATFLRGHIQRRHAGVAEGGKQKKQEQPVEEVLEELRAKLKWTQGELEAQREAERQRQLQEAELIHQREIEAKKEFDKWKEQEWTKLYGEIDKLKKLFWDEFKNVAKQNSTLEEKLRALQSHSVMESKLGSLRDEESEEWLRQARELQALREKTEIQKTEWKRKVKELHEEHMAEKKEIQSLSLRKVEGIHKVPKAVDTEEDSPEEEMEDSQDEQHKVLAALRRNPTLLKHFRPILEDTLEEKLESMGIRKDAKGISIQTLRHLESLLRVQREQKARKFSEFLSLRGKLVKEVTSRAKERQENGAVVSQPDGQPSVKSQQSTLVTREAQPKTRTLQVALPSTPAEPPPPTRQSHGSHGSSLTQVSAPAPRPGLHGPSSTPPSSGPGMSTPPFSSEEDSEGDRVQRVSLQPPKVPSRMVPRPKDDWDWSDTETSEENAQPPGQGSGTLVQSMVKNLEKQLEAPAKKPAGGVSLFFMPNAGPQRAATPGRKPQVGCRMLRVYSGILYRTSSEFGGPGVKVGEGPASVILCPSGTLWVTSLCPCAHGEMASLEYLYPS
ncbi:cilium assembly protein DZIP1L isoform X4 [Homo sapiens]|uniref:cilium assembly protein DZIP1L isoform X4 n=1 Tax=Homo sapiens TaxID=9606 RepID=UPI0005D01D8C|nr:cilium assembly protein DZIP1L isoform X4 [Homo sapiens]XP_054201547.1 cilium assembly protein DZIP1L isoform X4 [Homo sapiens]|eukprot:XP_011510826.1 zinc finger protein DZIP1L isoform X4 [Homo sapiens]